MHDGEELVEEPFHRLIGEGKLMAYPHDGFWACMDTFKEKQDLEDDLRPGQRALGGVESSSRNQEMIACNLSGMRNGCCAPNVLAVEHGEFVIRDSCRGLRDSGATFDQSASMRSMTPIYCAHQNT